MSGAHEGKRVYGLWMDIGSLDGALHGTCRVYVGTFDKTRVVRTPESCLESLRRLGIVVY